MGARALRLPSIAFSGRRSDKGALDSKRSHETRDRMGHATYQSLVEEINRLYRGLREERGERPPLANGQ